MCHVSNHIIVNLWGNRKLFMLVCLSMLNTHYMEIESLIINVTYKLATKIVRVCLVNFSKYLIEFKWAEYRKFKWNYSSKVVENIFLFILIRYVVPFNRSALGFSPSSETSFVFSASFNCVNNQIIMCIPILIRWMIL